MTLREKLTAKALKLLSYRPRSIHEIRFRLKQIPDSDKLIDQVVKLLVEQDFLNDQKFATWWVDQRVTHRPRGNIALKQELFQKGIDNHIVESVLLSSKAESSLAKRQLASKSITLKSKAFKVLRSKGFTSQSILTAIDELNLKE